MEEKTITPEEQGGDNVPKEGTEQNVKEGTEKPTAIEAATALAERIDAGNKKAEELLVRQEKLHAEQMLGGGSNAGQEPPKKEKMTDEEYKNKVLTGEIPKKDE